MLMSRLLMTGLVLGAVGQTYAADADLQIKVDWKTFLARHDLVWKAAPTGPFTGPFVGNGVVGAMLYQQEDSLRLDIGRTDVAEHAPMDGKYSALARIGRLPIGHFELKPPAPISGWDARLDLYQAEFVGKVRTARGDGRLRLFAHATEPVIVFEWKFPEKDGAAQLQWVSGDARVERGARKSPHRNPPPEITTRGEVNVCTQSRIFGGDYTTAWRDVALEDGTSRLFVSIVDRFPEKGSADRAVAAVERAVAMDFDEFVQPGGNPCSETYGATCHLLQEMLLQSWGGKIRVFPGVPPQWQEAVFHNLRAQGAFLVSAVRREGKTGWIRIESLAGEPCVVKADFGGETLKVLANREMKLTPRSPGVWSLDLKKGEAAVLYAGDGKPKLEVAPVAMKEEKRNRYGLRTAHKPKTPKKNSEKKENK